MGQPLPDTRADVATPLSPGSARCLLITVPFPDLASESFPVQVVTSGHTEVASRKRQFVLFSLQNAGGGLKKLGLVIGH